jgi:membrane protein required for colicin V production
MDLNYFDIVLLVLFLLFLLRGVMNGFVSEFSGLLGLFGGLWYASYAYTDIVPYLSNLIRDAFWRDLAAYGLVFISVLAAVALLARVVSKAFSLIAPPSLDKSLGAVLGLLRGMVVCSLSLVLLQHFMPDMHFFKNSLITPWLEPFLNFARLHLPAGLV